MTRATWASSTAKLTRVESPRGAWPTECPPAYERDDDWQSRWFATAKDPEARTAMLDAFADEGEA